MSWREDAKRRAALEAAKKVKDGYIIGLGSGSTVAYAIRELGRRIREENLKILGVPSSYKTFLLAVKCGVPLTTLNEHPLLSLDIDGADQIDDDLNLIKGMGGALTREKIVAAASEKLIIVADETKLTSSLGRGQLLPVEVLPFALPLVADKIRRIGGKPRLRERKDGSGPYVTDNGNFILDVDFGVIEDPMDLESRLKRIPGIIETGLFIGVADEVFIGTQSGVKILKRKM
ncbi:ribose-5-phosphate isomerase RpiA [Candidatus Bathyarchaeota archaeon]|nr:MAG: ribose-5-phosphate isomerase RpiA [Candidatus Bathyarchaeota archaeon]